MIGFLHSGGDNKRNWFCRHWFVLCNLFTKIGIIYYCWTTWVFWLHSTTIHQWTYKRTKWHFLSLLLSTHYIVCDAWWDHMLPKNVTWIASKTVQRFVWKRGWDPNLLSHSSICGEMICVFLQSKWKWHIYFLQPDH